MNNKAQTTIFTMLFWIIIFVLLLGAGFGYFIMQMTGLALSFGSLSGIEAFLVATLPLFIILAFIIAVIWWSR
jgi:pheromone shutdown protein TraB